MKDLKKRKDIPYSKIQRLTILLIWPVDLQVQNDPRKIPAGFWRDWQADFNSRGPWIVKTVLNKNSTIKGLTFPDFRTYYKTVWYWHRPTDQWNRSGIQKSLHLWSIDCWPRCQDNSVGKTTVFSTERAGKTGEPGGLSEREEAREMCTVSKWFSRHGHAEEGVCRGLEDFLYTWWSRSTVTGNLEGSNYIVF